jgi:hypothetical protein
MADHKLQDMVQLSPPCKPMSPTYSALSPTESEEDWARERLWCRLCEVHHEVSQAEDPDVCNRHRYGPHFKKVLESIAKQKAADRKLKRRVLAGELIDNAKEAAKLLDVILRAVAAPAATQVDHEAIRAAAAQARRLLKDAIELDE